jgi:oligosaccharide 4-alpha-D-glucosyltransferase
MLKRIALLLLVFIALTLKSQVINVTPEQPSINSNLTIVFDATQGNAGLKDYSGTVYAHTGVITTESNGSGDWKHVVANWGTADPKVEMTPLGNNKYKIEYNIKTFYGILPSEQVLELAFLFRNANGSLVGRSDNNGDIFYPINSDSIATQYQSAVSRNDSLIITCTTGTIYIVPYTSTIISITARPASGLIQENSYSTILTPETVSTQFTETTSKLTFSTDQTVVVVDKSNLSIHFLENGDTLTTATKPFSFMGSGGVLSFEIKNDERIYGTGSRATSLDCRGQKYNVYNSASYGYGYGATNLNICLPIITSSAGYGIFVDNHSRATWDIGSTVQNRISYTYQGGASSFYYIGGKSYANISKNITLLTGRQPLPPRWAFGFIQSKFGYQYESEARSIVTTLRSNKFPLDAIVLDLYWFGSPQTMGKLDWDYSRFPNPTKMMSDFNNIGVKTILISETYFTQQTSNFNSAAQNGYLAKNSSGNAYVLGSFWAGSAGLLDITNPDAANWLWTFYKARTDEGASGWWTDLGEPESHPDDMIHFGGKLAKEIHNIYGLEWARVISDKWNENYPSKRLFNLTRSGYAGMQRYSTFPWSGDIQRSFDGLRAQIPIMLSLGLTGIGYMHSDVGGFTGGGQDNELFTRWVQFGAFAPILRIHGTGIPTEPTAYSPSTQTIARSFINLRYSLLPYNYSLAWINSTTGEPLVRPLDYFEPANALLQNNNDEFFWGPNFLVAPILQQGQTSRNVIFPTGKWVDWWSSKVYNGNSTSNISAPIDRIPIFARSGSFIPMVRPKLSTEFYKSDSLFIKYFVDTEVTNSEFTMFDDDGKTTHSVENGNFQLIHFSSSTAPGHSEIYIDAEGIGFTGMPSLRNLFFEMPNINAAPSQVLVNSTPTNQRSTNDDLLTTTEGWYWNTSKNVLNIHLPWNGDYTTIAIEGLSVGIPTIKNPYNSILISDIYPNPADELINFSVTLTKAENLKISILSIDGMTMFSFEGKKYSIGTTELSYNVQHFKTGLYFVKVSGENGTSVKKWVKS